MPGSLNPQAEELNRIIRENNPVILDLLSQKGRAIYFPKDGILGQTAQAKGTKINATIGIALEDDGSPVRFSSIADRINLPSKDIFPYAPSYGKPELRYAWLEDMGKKNPTLTNLTSTPVVTSALTHALSVIGYLFVNEGERIILPDKLWGNYRLVFENTYGGRLDTYNTFKNNGFDIGSFRNKVEGTKEQKLIILFNFPNNPTGYTVTEEEAKELVAIIKNEAEKGKRIVVILDDAYFGLVYKDGILKESLFSFLADIHPNVLAVKTDGATKEQYVWGLRVGFITYSGKGITKETCTALEDKTAGAVRGSISNASHLSQSLVLAAMKSPDYEKEKAEKYALLKTRFETVREVLTDSKYKEFFTPLPFNSGYFMCIELKNGIGSEIVRQTLINKYSTGVISISNMLRIAFSSVPTDKIKQLFENIYQACNKLKSS